MNSTSKPEDSKTPSTEPLTPTVEEVNRRKLVAETRSDFHTTKIYDPNASKATLHSRDFAAGWKAHERIHGFALDIFTCNRCPQKYDCEYAWDHYNTGGDCLAEK